VKVEKQLFHFLADREEGKLLLALSGGHDSLALFKAMVALGRPFSVAHFDHRWRAESGEEARRLRTFVEGCGIRFYLGRGESVERNREGEAREQRYRFLFETVRAGGYRALLVGHHADDQAETVLKRIAEGASLMGLPALRPVSEREGVEIWRPLLSLSRADIGEEGFDDPANRDETFVRTRLRHSLIPHLEEAIGKGVRANLCRFADRSAQWASYLDEKIAGVGRCEGELGAWIDLRGLHPVERDHLMRSELRRRSIALSHEEIGQMQGARFERRKGGWTVGVDRDRLFFLDERRWESVHWRVEEGGGAPTGWRGLFEGRLTAALGSRARDRRSALSKSKVPHLLWDRLPPEWEVELLTGKTWPQGDAARTISLFPQFQL